MRIPLIIPNLKAVYQRRQRAFTMIEIALAVGVIGFALVAIIGILPAGMNVQKNNREDTIISQDAPYFLNAIRNGEMRTNHNLLTGYVETISNSYNDSVTSVTGGTGSTVYQNPVLNPTGQGFAVLTNDETIIGLLSTPQYDARYNASGVMITNSMTAIIRAMTGAATEQNGAFPATALRYALTVEIDPWNSLDYDSTNYTNPEYAVNSPASIVRSNRWYESTFLTNDMHELRLMFAWPVLPNGTTGPNRQTYRSLISGHLLLTNIPSITAPVWFFQSQSYTNNTTAY